MGLIRVIVARQYGVRVAEVAKITEDTGKRLHSVTVGK
jgi:hypothetical protein